MTRGTDHFDEKPHSSVSEPIKEEEVDNLNYPQPWKFEKWFLGGYSQKRMLKFKNPKTMYYAINLFAGTNIETTRSVQNLGLPLVL